MTSGNRQRQIEATEVLKVDNITVRLYEPPQIPGWSWFPTTAKLWLSKLSGAIQTVTARNTTTLDMHEWLVGRSDPNGQPTPDISELAVGRSTTAVAEADTGLNDEVDRVGTTSTERLGDTLLVRTFLDKPDGNVNVSGGESLSEVGLYADTFFLNHSVLTNDIDKDSTKTATIEVEITYDAA